MTPFAYRRAESLDDAILAAGEPGTALLAGGTTLVDLMRGDVAAPSHVVDIGRLPGLDQVEVTPQRLRIGALAKMADIAEHDVIRRDYPGLSESLQQAASQQLRNMATVGGNVLQRTRCGYFRDGRSACNKRAPGSGCSALDGANRDHAVLGTSEACIATYPGDWGVALAALGAEVEVASSDGRRTVPFEELHREPGDRPDRETNLCPGDVITAILIPATPMGRRSVYLKVRDRQSYAFAVASAAVALRMEGGQVEDARIALGGVATRPWRSREAEATLRGRPFTDALALEAGRAAFAGASARGENRVKLTLGPRVVARALITAASREVMP